MENLDKLRKRHEQYFYDTYFLYGFTIYFLYFLPKVKYGNNGKFKFLYHRKVEITF